MSVRYVAANGNDYGSCSAAHPCRSTAHAIAVASPGSVIAIGPGTFVGNITIDKPLTMVGRGRSTILSGSPTSLAATVAVAPGVTTCLESLTVQNPSRIGDGVQSSGNLVVKSTVMSHNGNAGLDILAGRASVSNSTFASNGAYGIANAGSLAIASSLVTHNDYGVAIDGSATLDSVTVSDNDSGGVLTLVGSTTVDASAIVGNHGVGVQAYSGSTHVVASTITGNGFYGVASEPTPYAAPPQVDVEASTIRDNSPGELGGGTPISVTGSVP